MKHTYSQRIIVWYLVFIILSFVFWAKLDMVKKDSIRKHLFLTEMILLSAATIFLKISVN